ncbi:MBL fold metallo-hydrolase [Paenibacillus sp. Soil787]|uniref:MBL fold metallo-hydrolase n=1 Tax=Paenibacillus sp. Soil787 TaxID=1736411 RepID=UPI00070345D4|nr:MBL fold metallo-hydrolase [Paenibacillus sp. Soil787]KRF19449.1 MBL fold metallo-hydrolase [Paenibacillus sp. Soil787]
MNTVKIIRIPILPMHMINSHLLAGPDGCILVDAGLPGSENKIKMALAKERLTFKDIKLIVVTHAHVDHAGSAALIRELSGAPILAHEGDAKHFNRETPMTFCPTGWFGRLFIKTPLMLEPYVGFEPDILLSKHDVIDLSRYGIPGIVKYTPGHTSGSISIELASNEALVGDLVASGILLGGIVRTSHAIRPPFEDDPYTVARELTRLLDSGVEKFYMGHGGPLKASEIHRHAQTLMMLPKK